MNSIPGPKRKDMAGLRFGKLTVLAEDTSKHGHGSFWFCQCECGTIKSMRSDGLRSGRRVSCGCVSKEMLSMHRVETHGLSKRGACTRRLVSVWLNMVSRCTDPTNAAWKNYGGRGITICEMWRTVEGFIENLPPGYSYGLTIDRRDNNLGYSPENCRWITKGDQNYNRRNAVWVETPIGVFRKCDAVFMYGLKRFKRVPHA